MTDQEPTVQVEILWDMALLLYCLWLFFKSDNSGCLPAGLSGLSDPYIPSQTSTNIVMFSYNKSLKQIELAVTGHVKSQEIVFLFLYFVLALCHSV